MLDISDEEPTPEPNISPSSPNETTYMSIDSDAGADGDNDNVDDDDSSSTGNTDDDDDENTGLGNEGDFNPLSETVSHRPRNPAAATVDSDTESETSDEESEYRSVSPLNPENTGCSGPPSAQAGRCSTLWQATQ